MREARVRVSFPNGERDVPAEYHQKSYSCDTPILSTLTPSPMPGWRFLETTEGWIAVEDLRD